MGKWEKIEIDNLVQPVFNINPSKEIGNNGFTYIDISSINREKHQIEEPKILTGNKAPSRAKQKLILGDILFATTRPNLKNVAILEQDFDLPIGSTGFCVLRTKKEKLENKYLFYFLISNYFQILIKHFIRGTQYPAISDKDLKKINILLPPLDTQRQIVSKLDALFENIDASLELLREDLEEAEALKASVLDEEISMDNPRARSEKWDESLLINVAEFQPKKSQVRDKSDMECSFVPMNIVNEKEKTFIPEETKTISEVYNGYTYFEDNDVLLAKVTPCFENGKGGIARNLTNGIGFGSSEFFVFRPSNKILSDYLYYFFSRGEFLQDGANNMSGAVGLKRVRRDFIETQKIPLPPIDTQHQIVSKLDTLFSHIDGLISEITEKIENLEALKGSLLDKAFKGELI